MKTVTIDLVTYHALMRAAYYGLGGVLDSERMRLREVWETDPVGLSRLDVYTEQDHPTIIIRKQEE